MRLKREPEEGRETGGMGGCETFQLENCKLRGSVRQRRGGMGLLFKKQNGQRKRWEGRKLEEG